MKRCEGYSVPGSSFKSTPSMLLTHPHHFNWPLVLKLHYRGAVCLGDKLCRSPLAPLFKVKRDLKALTLMQEACDPIRMHRPRSRSTLATSNDPINRIKTISPEP